jgi:hypothetical protein
MSDLTILFYTANYISDYFMGNIQKQLLKAIGDTPLISVSHKPMDFGENICVGDIGRSAYNIYKQVLIGAKAAKTKYVATAEDDVLYPEEHFRYRPPEDTMAYDINRWGIYTWTKPPIFSYRDRRNMTSLIAPRDELIRTLEERFTKYPTPEDMHESIRKYWGEPGRYDSSLGISKVKNERYKSSIPHIMFSTPEALAFKHLGVRKAHSKVRAKELPYWGTAEEVLKLYIENEE